MAGSRLSLCGIFCLETLQPVLHLSLLETGMSRGCLMALRLRVERSSADLELTPSDRRRVGLVEEMCFRWR